MSTASDVLCHDNLPLAMRVAQQLREQIVNGVLSCGTRLIEHRLSEEFGVSRVPIREALRLLVIQGLVEIVPRRGAMVCQMEEGRVQEVIEVRATLEALNARLAAQRRDAAHCDALAALVSQADRLQGAGLDVVVAANAQFHRMFDELAQNTVLQDMMQPLRQRTMMLFGHKEATHIMRDFTEHVAIARAIIAGDKALAALLARRHVYGAAGMPLPV